MNVWRDRIVEASMGVLALAIVGWLLWTFLCSL